MSSGHDKLTTMPTPKEESPMPEEVKIYQEQKIIDELWELLPPDFSYKNVDRKTMCNWLKSRLEILIQGTVSDERNRIDGGVKEMIAQLQKYPDDPASVGGADSLHEVIPIIHQK